MREPARLLGQDQALALYLEALFRPAPSEPAPEPLAQPGAPAPVEDPAPARAESEPAVPLAAEPEPGWPAAAPLGPPAWAQGPFDALLLDLGGARLAVPLTALAGLRRLEGGLTRLPGAADWVSGVFKDREQSVRVAATAALLGLPRQEGDPREAEGPYVALLGASGWGLACERAATVLHLRPEDVRWRAQRQRKPWLAGILRKQLCALLDPEALVAWLDQSTGS